MVSQLTPTAWASSLSNPLSKDVFKLDAGQMPTDIEIEDFVTLWLAEGAAQCFSDMPVTYQMVRRLVGNKLGIPARDVGLSGSGKIGFSLSPHKNMSDFDKNGSDLDLFVISAALFQELSIEFNEGVNIVSQNTIGLKEKELYFFNINCREVPITLRKGFVDTNRIPYHPTLYSGRKAKKCYLTAKSIVDALRDDPHRWQLKKSSIRVYNDWSSAIHQKKISLKHSMNVLSRT